MKPLNELDNPRHQMIWVTKDGTRLRLEEMDDNHLRNATNMVGRQITNLHEELTACWSCISMFQGDMAIYHAEQSADSLSEDIHNLEIKYAVMLQACQDRNIKL